MFSWVISLFCTVVIISCSAAGLVVVVTQAAWGHTPSTSYTLEFPGITCKDIKHYIDHGISDPHHKCH